MARSQPSSPTNLLWLGCFPLAAAIIWVAVSTPVEQHTFASILLWAVTGALLTAGGYRLVSAT